MHVSDFEGAIKQIVRKVNIDKATLASDHEAVALHGDAHKDAEREREIYDYLNGVVCALGAVAAKIAPTESPSPYADEKSISTWSKLVDREKTALRPERAMFALGAVLTREAFVENMQLRQGIIEPRPLTPRYKDRQLHDGDYERAAEYVLANTLVDLKDEGTHSELRERIRAARSQPQIEAGQVEEGDDQVYQVTSVATPVGGSSSGDFDIFGADN